MSPLADLQEALAKAVFAGAADVAGLPAFIGRIPPDVAFGVHRGTVVGALTNAPRLTYPTVDDLVGEAFFDQAALAFIAAAPPRTADLSAYGDGYPAFLASFAPAAELSYLADVASLDLAIARAQRTQDAPPRRFGIDVDVALEIPASLTLVRLTYPADEIRAAIEANDRDSLSGLDMTERDKFVAVWRSPEGAAVRPLGPCAGRFLKALLGGEGAEDAIAAGGGDVTAALAEIEVEVFRASFTTIRPFAED